MTQSGQGGQGGEHELPAARPAHEGVVLPADGGAPWGPGASGQGGQGEQTAPAGGRPWGQQWGPQQPDQQPQGGYGYPQSQPLPPARQPGDQEAYQQPGYTEGYQQPQQPGGYQQPQRHDGYQQAQQSDGYQQPQQYGSQNPSPYDSPYSQQQHQHHDRSSSQPLPHAQPLPPEAGAGAPGGPGGYGGQGSGGQGASGGDADATQYIAPVPGGPGPVADRQGGGDADATQYIPPVPGGAPYGIRPGAPEDRQPPAEFDSLFRSEQPAGATQQLPQYDAGGPAAYQQRPRGGPPAQAPGGYDSGLQGFQGRAEYDEADQHGGGAPRRRSAHITLIAAVIVGAAVIGLGAGALMSGGDSDDDKQPVASQSSPATSPTSEAAPPDPAEPQAEALDKLLADSNNSRATVISAVEKIRSCKDLDAANTDLRDAARERRDLVTRLDGLTVDELPRQAELVAALNRAWKASAAADEHYAAWARQAKKSKGVCKGGKARSTNETAKANQQSGVATQAKREASALWNAIAVKYGLTKHTYTEL
ncbi:hypothetical protein ACFY8V_00565 [Streptomyces californicus]|uniref:hypothetical protein n=1 Tax=Streptomyces californicus TaxID=67351 RepID=UPI0036B8FE39